MELILTTPIEELTPKLIAFNNKEIINQLKPQLEHYKQTTYTEDQLAVAKKDRATLNKFRDAIEDERKRIKKYYNQPYDKFEMEVKEITALIDETSKTIDDQVKYFEENKKSQKKTEIIKFWNENIGNLDSLINIENIFSEQWLNTTYAMKKVQEDILAFVSKVNSDLSVITSLNFKQETHLKDFYLKTFDLTATLQEKQRIEENEKKLAEFNQKQEQQLQPKEDTNLEVIDFRVWVTLGQKQAIRQFLIDNKIKYGKVPNDN